MLCIVDGGIKKYSNDKHNDVCFINKHILLVDPYVMCKIFVLEPLFGSATSQDMVIQKILPTSSQISGYWPPEDWHYCIVHVLVNASKHISKHS